MRAIWTGEISFGLVTIPTKLYSATRDLTPTFHWIHKVCGTRVQTVRRCSHCDREVPWSEIEKGYEVSAGKYARFSKEELSDALTDEVKGVIEIVSFVEPGEVDLAFIERSYWAGSSGRNAQSFHLLRSVLESSGRVGLAKVAIRERTRLALLRPRGKLFALDMMRYADELIDPSDVEVPRAKAASEKELRLAQTLVDQLTEKFHPEKHPDEYRARVNALVDRKVKRHELDAEDAPVASRSKKGTKVADLSEILARSLAAARGKVKAVPGRRVSHPAVA